MAKSRSATLAAVLLCLLFAVTLSGCGKSSSAASSTTTTSSGIKMAVAAGNQQVTVSWDDPSGTSASNATYNVYCSNTVPDTSLKDDGTLIASNVTSPFVHTGLINGQTYYYFVTKVTGNTVGPASLSASAVPMAALPAAPSGMTISTGIQASNGLGTVTLTIPKADSSLTYNVYWSTNSGDIKSIGTKIANAFTISGTTASFTHNNLAIDGNTTYYYVVTAVGDGESSASPVLSAKPVFTKAVSYSATGPTPSQYGSPKSIETDIANQSVTITWGAPNSSPSVMEASTSQTYTIYYWDSSGSQSSAIKIPNISSDTTSLVINSGLTNGKTYNFYVAAVQNVLDSTTGATISTKETPSAILSVVPQAKVLAAPSAVATSAGDQQVSLSWTKVSDPSGGTVKYNVYCTTNLPTSGTTQANWSLVGTTTATSFVHSGLATGKTYYYVITSMSDQSSESAATWTSYQVSMKL